MWGPARLALNAPTPQPVTGQARCRACGSLRQSLLAALSISISDSVAAPWIFHFDIVKFVAGNGTGPHLHAVLPANNNALKMLIPPIDGGGADQGALLFFALKTLGGILDLQMGLLIHFILIEKQLVFNSHDLFTTLLKSLLPTGGGLLEQSVVLFGGPSQFGNRHGLSRIIQGHVSN